MKHFQGRNIATHKSICAINAPPSPLLISLPSKSHYQPPPSGMEANVVVIVHHHTRLFFHVASGIQSDLAFLLYKGSENTIG